MFAHVTNLQPYEFINTQGTHTPVVPVRSIDDFLLYLTSNWSATSPTRTSRCRWPFELRFTFLCCLYDVSLVLCAMLATSVLWLPLTCQPCSTKTHTLGTRAQDGGARAPRFAVPLATSSPPWSLSRNASSMLMCMLYPDRGTALDRVQRRHPKPREPGVFTERRTKHNRQICTQTHTSYTDATKRTNKGRPYEMACLGGQTHRSVTPWIQIGKTIYVVKVVASLRRRYDTCSNNHTPRNLVRIVP